jgi:uroporphyrinogen-III decarboxylase
MIPAPDKLILRELAKQVRDLAALDVNRRRIARIREMHGLKPGRPPVWIDEIPWHEMDIDGFLAPRCESEEGRNMERQFRRTLYRWKYIQVDMVVEDAFFVPKAFTDSGIGIKIKEETLATSAANNIVSHHYEDQLDTEEKVEALKIPVIEARPDIDKKNLESAGDVLDGIMPVKLRGHGIYYAPWDEISMLRGIENCLVDMVSNPELVHKTIAKFTEIGLARYTQMEARGLLDFNISALHCTPPYCDELPAKDWDGGRVRFKDLWFRGMAQLFSSASPGMQDEFDLQYMRKLMDRCGLSYYGCCEPLDRFIPYLKKVPNMRKIGVSPWADVRSSAEQMGGGYVFARKPNPANVARDFSKEVVEREITETIEACMENKCPYEFVLKDISTVGGKPQNLINWAKTVTETIDHYYG